MMVVASAAFLACAFPLSFGWFFVGALRQEFRAAP
jgi:hypothetical protein